MTSATSLMTLPRVAIGLSALIAVGVPTFLLSGSATPADPPPPVVASTFDMTPPEEPDKALASPLFNAERVAPPNDALEGNATAATDISSSNQSPILVGLIIGGRSLAMALLKAASGETNVVHAGDMIDGWQVSDISPSGVSVTKGGSQQRLTLDYSNKAGGDSASDPSISQPVNGAPK